MFHTVITADLPSQEKPGAAPTDDDFAKTHDRVLFSAARLILTLRQALDGAGVRDVTHVLIDGELVYEDSEDSDDTDLDRLLEVTREEGFLNRDFQEIVVALIHWEDGINHVVQVRARMAVPVGEHELEIRIASRVDDFNARRLDDAERFASRLLEYASDLDVMSRYSVRCENLANRIHASLGRALFRREVSKGRTMLRIVRPTRADFESMNNLYFGEAIKPPVYQLVPVASEDSGWDDPAVNVLDDAFLVFRHWVFLHALMVEGFLRIEWVEVVEPDGKVLFQGHKARWFENWPWARKFEVDLIDEGGVVVQFVDDAASGDSALRG